MLNKKNLYPIIALTVIGVVVAGFLAAVNMLTLPVIEEAERRAILESLQEVMPDAEGFDAVELSEDTPDTVKEIYEESSGKGSVVILKVQGYASIISITVGVDSDGKITRAIVTSEQESHGQAGMASYPDNFTGLNASGVVNESLYSGATVTSGAIRDAISDAMYALGYVVEGGGESAPEELPKDDAQIKSLAESYFGAKLTAVELSADAPKTLKRLYYHEESGSYVAYNITSTKYVKVETEGFVIINKSGVITKVYMLEWTVGHGVYPPVRYTDTFIGKDRYSIVSSELVTAATGTSVRFAAAIQGALDYVAPEYSWQSIVGTVILALSVLTPIGYIIFRKIRGKRA